jgi:hypothetical protein
VISTLWWECRTLQGISNRSEAALGELGVPGMLQEVLDDMQLRQYCVVFVSVPHLADLLGQGYSKRQA